MDGLLAGPENLVEAPTKPRPLTLRLSEENRFPEFWMSCCAPALSFSSSLRFSEETVVRFSHLHV